MSDDNLETMFKMHGALQQRYIGKHPAELKGDELVQYLKDMAYAAEDEIHEMMDEVDWKPWTPGNSVNFQRAKQEMIDEWHFFMNRWLALGGTSDEFVTMYFAKAQKNHGRIDSGYDGRSTKCAECHTDLDELSEEDQLKIVAHRGNEAAYPLRFCNMDHLDDWLERQKIDA